LIATNAGLIGISRLSFSLAHHGLTPKVFSKIHPRFQTPFLSIIVFGLIGIVILIPGFFSTRVFENVGALYAFGSLLAFMFSHASIIAIRIREPKLHRPFKLAANIHVKGREIPITAVLGFLFTACIWVVISITQPYSRWVGIAWMILGLLVYWIYSRRKHKNKP
jgi:APA family basic amino acid/polyamine antiporter